LFANFAAVNAGAWSEAIRLHGIVATQRFNGNNGKNSSDIALVIAAMDRLATGSIDRFVVVTSD